MNKLEQIGARLSDADWLKLRDFSKRISSNIMRKLPGDWLLSDDDVQGAVYGTFVKLLANYRPGAMSPTSYCWQFAERWTLLTLMNEYRRLKKQVALDDLEEPADDDEYAERRQYGKYEVEPYRPLDEHLEESGDVDRVLEIADAHGLGKIARMMKTMSEREIARELCQTHQAVHKKIEKLRRLCRDAAEGR